MDTEQIVSDIITALEACGTPERAEMSKYYFPTKMRVIGCTNPDAKLVLKSMKEMYRNFNPGEWLELAVQLVNTDIFECQGIACELIGRNKKLWPAVTMQHIIALKRNLDNWASVDGFAVYVTGVQWRLGTVKDAWIHGLLDSENHWDRRLAVVSTVALNLKSRGGTGDVPRTLAVCERVVDDRHDMVVKGLSWALRELSKRDRQVVSDFLERYDPRLANWVKREVWHKLEFGTKN